MVTQPPFCFAAFCYPARPLSLLAAPLAPSLFPQEAEPPPAPAPATHLGDPAHPAHCTLAALDIPLIPVPSLPAWRDDVDATSDVARAGEGMGACACVGGRGGEGVCRSGIGLGWALARQRARDGEKGLYVTSAHSPTHSGSGLRSGAASRSVGRTSGRVARRRYAAFRGSRGSPCTRRGRPH